MKAAFKPAADFSSPADSSSASSSWPGLARPSTSFRDLRNKAVDGRAKPAHDEFNHNRTHGIRHRRRIEALRRGSPANGRGALP